jgi:hypothetical protein
MEVSAANHERSHQRNRKPRPPSANACYTRPPRVRLSAAGATTQPDARVRKPARECPARRSVSSWQEARGSGIREALASRPRFGKPGSEMQKKTTARQYQQRRKRGRSLSGMFGSKRRFGKRNPRSDLADASSHHSANPQKMPSGPRCELRPYETYGSV